MKHPHTVFPSLSWPENLPAWSVHPPLWSHSWQLRVSSCVKSTWRHVLYLRPMHRALSPLGSDTQWSSMVHALVSSQAVNGPLTTPENLRVFRYELVSLSKFRDLDANRPGNVRRL